MLSMQIVNSGITNTYTYIKDHLGSIVALVDETGTNVVESYEYDAWGAVTVYDANESEISLSSVKNHFLWHGREYNWTVHYVQNGHGIYNFRNRWYDPVTGRWLSKDPIGISGGLNQYVFCANNPVNFVDPDGRAPWMLIGAAIGGGLDLAVQLAQGRSFSEVNWVSVGAGAASGALGAGLGANVARLTASITARAALNAVGSAAIGAGVQTACNAIEGNNLGAGVGSAAVISGTFGGLGSAFGDLAERSLISVSQNSQFIQSLLDSGALQGNSLPYLLPGEVLPPSTWSIVGTAIGATVSNLGPLVPASNAGSCQ
ncbi:MAG TPA: RHS repeat-associated core domain-containing protein [Kiritimatiellia bacterium]|nr:RHS repeat-associated core domain-containing protein [Kiritimatiellia bacterium]HNS80250.1 RHS repeat-associated core domain-containing protein [Kiritimatiellia bacterium]